MDDDDKLRRNLMISSFAVLLFFWLDLPEGAVVKRIIGDEYENSINPLRLWLVIIVVLIYQLIRFSANLLESPAHEAMRGKFALARHDEIHNWLARKIARNPKGKKIDGMDEVKDANVYISGDKSRELHWPSANLVNISSYKQKSVWAGDAFVYDKDHDTYNSRLTAEFKINKSKRLFIELRAVAALSKTSYFPEVGVPLFCSYVALICTAYQIGASM